MQKLALHPGNLYIFSFSGIFDECSQLDTSVEKVDFARVVEGSFSPY